MKKNSIIKIDDLYWNEEENKYVALSPEEIKSILLLALEKLPPEERTTENAMCVIEWAERARIGSLLLQGVLSGRLGININSQMQEPVFYELEGKNESPRTN